MSGNKPPCKPHWYMKSKRVNLGTVNKPNCSFAVTNDSKYEPFHLYFPPDFENKEEIIKNVHAFQCFIQNNTELFPLKKIKEQNYFSLDFKCLLNSEIEWENFKTEIFENVDKCLKCMELAMHQALIAFQEKSVLQDDVGISLVYARLFNVEPIRQIKDLKANLFEKLVTLKGTVIKISTPRLYCQYLAFKCGTCECIQVLKQFDGNYTSPTKCLSKGCKSHNFAPHLTSPYTRTINYQTIKLQEDSNDIQGITARVPRTMECDLVEDLVGSCIPGDDIILTGILKVRNSNEEGSSNKQSSIYILYIDCISIINEKVKSENTRVSRILFNMSDIPAIQKIHSEPQLFRLLVHSVCPNIYGHEIVKAGLLLALFGGTHSELQKRSNCHVLVVGDPGLGKSQLLKACSNLSPRGVYVCGNSTTGSGLTVTMVRESGGAFSLEAGALILADQGCCCIDEFDKMTTQHANLLEVMEQQCISIAKASISRNFDTRTSILAAANPVGGHYNKAKTVSENLKIGSPLLSRFDLIFVVLDHPDEHLDMLLSEHVLALHSGRHLRGNSDTSVMPKTECTTLLKNRLMLRPNENLDHLPHSLFRSYIAYAQKYVHPKLTQGAKDVLKQFYLELRQKYHVADSTPVTARQLESMKRLTQARAKLELRDEATTEDAIEVVEIMRHSLVDVFTDELGVLDFTRSPNGTGISNRKQVSKFVNVLQQKSEALQQSTFHIKELQEFAQHAGIAKSQFYKTIESLNIDGILLIKSNSMYQLVSANY